MDEIICTEVEVVNGVFTGKLASPVRWGEGKAQAVRELAQERGIDLRRSFGYGNGDEDVQFLEAVGKPRPLNPQRGLTRVAVERGWPVTRLRPRAGRSVRPLVRTGAALTAMGASAFVAAGVGLANRSRRVAANLTAGAGSELALGVAGVRLEVTGEQHLWSHRPAVFIFNHQSGVDFLLLCKMLRRDIVGIAKKELRSNPIFGPAFAAAGTVFIDRFDREKAIEAMKPAVEALREGLSIVIAPEGTRSPTPKLGRFKKGAFHLAMAAKAPIVPIVFRNALDALPKHAYFVRSAVIEAVVHPPILTDDWTVETLDERIEEIHKLYEDTLEGNL